jgi:hypothetical protein
MGFNYIIFTSKLSPSDEQKQDVFERKVLRRIYSPIQDGDTWRSRYNFELCALCKEPKLTTAIRIARLRWAGHMQCMEDEQTPKRFLYAKTSGRRNVGRPRSRWLDEANTDVRRMRIRMRWRRALGRRMEEAPDGIQDS